MAKYEGGQVTLEWDSAGGTAWTTVGQVGDISGPSVERTAIDATTRDTTPAYWREFIRGYKDGGELTFTIMYDPSLATHGTASGILGDFDENGTTIPAWRLGFPDATYCTFDGFLTGSEIGSAIDEALTSDVTVKITGAVTFP
jgi:hypothetical protein